ncbi:RAM signaling network component [Branchiostoma belcheri]|nr:RAM signaling network component [Branchiostoma belcheri]
MGRKLRHLLIFLLIFLKEPHMPEAACSYLFLTDNQMQAGTFANLPKLEELYLDNNKIRTIPSVENLPQLQVLDLQSNQMTAILPSAFSLLPAIRTIRLAGNPFECDFCGSVAGIVLIARIVLTVRYKMTRQPTLGLNPDVVVGNTNTTATVMASDDGNQYEDIDSNHDQTGQGQSQANIQSLEVVSLSNEVLAALKPNTMYAGMEIPPSDPTSTSCNNQTGQGQSQVITESNTNPKATVMTSGHDQTGQGQSQVITESNTNPKATIMTSGHDQTGQGQSQAITESNTNPKATIMTSGHDQTGQGQSQAITESNTNTTATVMTSGHDQTGQGQCESIAESLDARNLSYGTRQTSSQLSSLYTTATETNSSHDQIG